MTPAYIADHEAGHLIAAWASGHAIGFIHAQAGSGGGNVSYYTVVGDSSLPDVLWAMCVISVAGVAAQFTLGHTVKCLDVRDDLVGAREKAQSLAKTLDVRAAFPVQTDNADQLARMYVEPMADSERHVIEAAYLKAKYLLNQHRARFTTARLALRIWNLDSMDIALLLGGRPRGPRSLGFARRQSASWLLWVSSSLRLLLLAAWKVFGVFKGKELKLANGA